MFYYKNFISKDSKVYPVRVLLFDLEPQLEFEAAESLKGEFPLLIELPSLENNDPEDDSSI